MAEDGKLFRILSLDGGGGAKGFYTLGVLREIDGLIGCSLFERFDLIFSTSTGGIIAVRRRQSHNLEAVASTHRR